MCLHSCLVAFGGLIQLHRHHSHLQIRPGSEIRVILAFLSSKRETRHQVSEAAAGVRA
jgi:hypothetical protein